jgi:hypothetical protein
MSKENLEKIAEFKPSFGLPFLSKNYSFHFLLSLNLVLLKSFLFINLSNLILVNGEGRGGLDGPPLKPSGLTSLQTGFSRFSAVKC